ncbi:hypothetical protein M885DRAFT_561855 [Pelagophyceae sp. CCMP2097]|nr:hypothetical protein M885DRAFT_561855 [Pelagophyceae sp. CCMP2097]
MRAAAAPPEVDQERAALSRIQEQLRSIQELEVERHQLLQFLANTESQIQNCDPESQGTQQAQQPKPQQRHHPNHQHHLQHHADAAAAAARPAAAAARCRAEPSTTAIDGANSQNGSRPRSAVAAATASAAHDEASQSDEAGPPVGARATEAECERAFLESLAPMAVTDGLGAFVDCNHRFSELSGYSRHELKAHTIVSLTDPTQLQAAMATFDRLLRRDTPRGSSYAVEAVSKPNGRGTVRRLRLAVSLLAASSDDDRPTHILVAIVDPSERSHGLNGR